MPVDNPIGLHARKLILDMTYTYAEDSVLKNITNAINLCHLKVENFIITPEASGIASTIQEEKKNGAIVIDLGGNLTSVGIFKNNNIIFSDTIPIGGVHITSDIVRGLGCKAEDAEKLKILHGSVISNEIDEYHNIDAPIISDDGKIRSQIIPKAMLTAMIKPRIEEIFDLIKNRLSVLSITKDIETIILCGGGANLNDIKHLTNLYFKKNARIGYPVNIINDLPEIVENPTFSCLIGLLIKSLEEENLTIALNDNSNFFNKFGRLGQWFDQNL
jgi:cell division protein FtsA